MATQVQRRRGTTTEHSTFTGAEGELTVDTTKDTVVVHDGATAGGRPLAREDLSNVSSADVTAKVSAGTPSAAGIVQLTDSTSSTSTTTAATPNSVKLAKDAADAAQATADAALPATGGTISSDLTISGDLTVDGTTTTVNSETLLVKDKNIEMGVVDTPTDSTADGGGITLKGATDKTITWIDATDAWTSSERFSVPLGSAASPSLTFTGDENSGLYSPGADQVAVATNGTGRLFVDASGKVGIAKTPELTLDVFGRQFIGGLTTRVDENSSYHLQIQNAGNTVLKLQAGASSDSYLAFGTTSSALNTAIQVNNSDNDLRVRTGGSEKLRITSTGKVGIGTSTPAEELDVAAANCTIRSTSTGDSTGKFALNSNRAASTVNGQILGQWNGNTVSRIDFFNGADGTNKDDGEIAFSTSNNASTPIERLRITQAGRLLVGTFTTIANKSYTNGAINPQFEIDGTGVPTATLTITNWNTAAASPAHVVLSKSKSGTVGTRTLVANNDDIGAVVFTADDGTAFIPAASILAEVDGTPAGPTPGPVSMPGRLVFSTTASGASSPTPRMRIDSSGNVGIGTTSPAAVLTTYAGGFDPSDNTVFDGVGLFLESSDTGGDGNYGSALAWNRPGSSTNFKCAIAPVQEGADVDLQGLAFFTADGTFTTSDPAERLRIDSSGRVGIGTTSPASKLHVYEDSASPARIYLENTEGRYEIKADANLALHYSTQFVFNNAAGTQEYARIDSSGNVGIGTTSPSYQLQLSTDSAGKPSTNTWTIVSDERIKDDIEPADLDICYDAVKNIPLKRFKWKDEVYAEEQVPDRHKIGWIAQDVETVFPKAVRINEFKYGEEGQEVVIEDCRDLNADQLYAAMYGTIQKLIAKVETLEAKVAALETP
jgi:hypothetical protein